MECPTAGLSAVSEATAAQSTPAPAPLSAGRVRACVALLVALGFVLGCSEFIVIGM